MKQKIQIFNTIKVIILAFVLTVGLQYAAAQSWSAPTGSPPSNNTYAPLNEGTGAQFKQGGLTLGTGAGVTTGLQVENGNFYVRYGNAGMGTTNLPAGIRLTVNGSTDTNGEIARFISSLGSSFVAVENSYGKNTLGVQSAGAWVGPTSNIPLLFKVNDLEVGKFSNSTGNLELVNQIKIAGGSPSDGKVLTATDSSGNAAWETLDQQTNPTRSSIPGSVQTGVTDTDLSTSNQVGTFTASCPSGKRLVSCTGGAIQIRGLNDGGPEAEHLIIPDVTNNSCTMYARGYGGLSGGLPDGAVRVYAICL